jgi:phospholipid N-methyltransferase
MTQFVESLCRLYKFNKINTKKLDELLASKKINKQEYDYIISAKNAI